MVIEGLLTTVDEHARPHVAPMGAIVEADWHRLTLRPFTSSQTFAHLQREKCGVFHVTDDVEMIAQAAVAALLPPTDLCQKQSTCGPVLLSACRWYGVSVESCEVQQQRATMPCQVVENGFLREFAGLCRAKHAVVEAAILATRTHLLPPHELQSALQQLAPLVAKTGGPSERRAFEFLRSYLASK